MILPTELHDSLPLELTLVTPTILLNHYVCFIKGDYVIGRRATSVTINLSICLAQLLLSLWVIRPPF